MDVDFNETMKFVSMTDYSNGNISNTPQTKYNNSTYAFSWDFNWNWTKILIAIFLCLLILCIVIGNLFVVLSVLIFREMRIITNALIISLATADLLLAIVVLPISLQNELTEHWTLGTIVCDFWLSSDVFCCTASILNIVVIAMDRYWLITKNVRYTHHKILPRRKVCILLVFLVWCSAGVISCLPLFGWRTGQEYEAGKCLISQDYGYTLFSTFGSFWLPLSAILALYLKIYRIARTRAIKRAKAKMLHTSLCSTVFSENHEEVKNLKSKKISIDVEGEPTSKEKRKLNNTERSNRLRARTRSSARTLGLIIGGFILCWLPFFLIATALPFCDICQEHTPGIMISLVLWLGYFNSLINPAIYAIWDKNFRRSFKRLATCDIKRSMIFGP